MITTEQTHTLLAAIVGMSGIATLVWAGMAWVARVTPRASLAMAGANLSALMSMALHTQRGVLPDALTYWPGDVFALCTFALLAVAVPAILTQARPWRLPLAVVIGAAAALLLQPYSGDMRWQARIVNLAAAALAFTAALAAWRHLRSLARAGRTPTLLALPLFLIALLMAARGIETFVHPGRTPDMRVPTEFNVLFLWTALTLTLVQNATLAFLVLMRLVLRLERLLERDGLTDLLNRRAFDLALAHAHAWLKRGRGYALVMIDMDRFKPLNDSLGHAAGDAALRQLAEVLQPCVRDVDRLGRLGGEEFCLLLPDTDLAGAALVAERMRALVAEKPLRWLDQDWPLSASFGVAEAERSDPSPDAVLARADAAMYRAKAQGRNVVQA